MLYERVIVLAGIFERAISAVCDMTFDNERNFLTLNDVLFREFVLNFRAFSA